MKQLTLQDIFKKMNVLLTALLIQALIVHLQAIFM
jgi:hypothetical protein